MIMTNYRRHRRSINVPVGLLPSDAETIPVTQTSLSDGSRGRAPALTVQYIHHILK